MCAPVTATSAYFTHTNKQTKHVHRSVPYIMKILKFGEKKESSNPKCSNTPSKIKVLPFSFNIVWFPRALHSRKSMAFFHSSSSLVPVCYLWFCTFTCSFFDGFIKWAVASAFVVLNDWQLFSISLQTSITIDLTFHLMILFEQWFTHT